MGEADRSGESRSEEGHGMGETTLDASDAIVQALVRKPRRMRHLACAHLPNFSSSASVRVDCDGRGRWRSTSRPSPLRRRDLRAGESDHTQSPGKIVVRTRLSDCVPAHAT
eukprot:4265285-Pleurochrysis_carterae.AAC.1